MNQVPKGSNIKKGDVMQATTEAMTSCGERLRDKSQEYLLSGKIVKYCTQNVLVDTIEYL